jgi:hypothetical protein
MLAIHSLYPASFRLKAPPCAPPSRGIHCPSGEIFIALVLRARLAGRESVA